MKSIKHLLQGLSELNKEDVEIINTEIKPSDGSISAVSQLQVTFKFAKPLVDERDIRDLQIFKLATEILSREKKIKRLIDEI